MPSYLTVQVQQLSTDFRAATKIIEVPELPVATPGNVVVQSHYVGINATDINVTNGVYGGEPPFGTGLEGVGVVVAVGDGVDNTKIGDAVAYQTFGAFAEYAEVAAATAIKVPTPDPSVPPPPPPLYPNGIDLVFETIGGEISKTAVDNIAVHGRILLFGYISSYADQGASDKLVFSQVGPTLLRKSASAHGFIFYLYKRGLH
ncbi:alcohol dehydrogenase, partial [Globisporangium splendens]